MKLIKVFLSGTILFFTIPLQAQKLTIIAQSIPKKASFRGISAVNERVAWASGSEGTVLRTIDGGNTWLDVSVPNADSIEFRDIEAFNADTALTILSVGAKLRIN